MSASFLLLAFVIISHGTSPRNVPRGGGSCHRSPEKHCTVPAVNARGAERHIAGKSRALRGDPFGEDSASGATASVLVVVVDNGCVVVVVVAVVVVAVAGVAVAVDVVVVVVAVVVVVVVVVGLVVGPVVGLVVGTYSTGHKKIFLIKKGC